jgi:hypothetical protein
MGEKRWPSLDYSQWADTCETLHMWTQVVGKLKMQLSPPEDHWWHVALHVTPRGLTTGPIPYALLTFQVDFDLIAHELRIDTSEGKSEKLKLEPKSVKTFYFEVQDAIRRLGIDVTIDPHPKEVPNPIRLDEDTSHASYDLEAIERFRRVLVQCDRILREFRVTFCGKSSPVNFYWGSFDLALTRFSGNRIAQKGSDGKTSQVEEEVAVGFWPGSLTYPKAAFYSYALPPPEGVYQSKILPAEARFDTKLGEFICDYESVQSATDPNRAILDFFQSTYEAAANLGHWDRVILECPILEPIPN